MSSIISTAAQQMSMSMSGKFKPQEQPAKKKISDTLQEVIAGQKVASLLMPTISIFLPNVSSLFM